MSDLPQSELLRPLRRIVTDIASKAVTVGALKGKDDRLKYVNSLKTFLPDLNKRTGTPEPLERLAAQAQAKNQSKAASTAKARSLLVRKALIRGRRRRHSTLTIRSSSRRARSCASCRLRRTRSPLPRRSVSFWNCRLTTTAWRRSCRATA